MLTRTCDFCGKETDINETSSAVFNLGIRFGGRGEKTKWESCQYCINQMHKKFSEFAESFIAQCNELKVCLGCKDKFKGLRPYCDACELERNT